MINRVFKNFVIFNRKQKDSELAAMDIDTALYSGRTTLVGDYYMVVFYTNYTHKTDEEAYKEQFENAKNILERYEINYDICEFED